MQEVRFNKLIIEQLKNIDKDIQRYMISHQQELGLMLSRMDGIDDWRDITNTYPLIRQSFVIQQNGERIYPQPNAELIRREEEFLQRSQILWQDQTLFQSTSVSLDEIEQVNSFSSLQKKIYKPNKQGWYTWFWGNGLNLAYWLQTANGTVLGADLDTTRIKSDLIVLLPDTSVAEISDDRIRLIDSGGDMVYQWGSYSITDSDIPLQRLSLSPPLSGWNLEYFSPKNTSLISYKRFHVLGIVAIFTVCLGLMALYLYREFRHDAIMAAQRVNFVNQVSHELKTPLTNIRMYAELLDDAVDEEGSTTKHYLNVITTESQRLSRLISNVLSFGRSERQHLKLQTCATHVSDVINKCIETFRPGLEQKNVKIIYKKSEFPEVEIDPDALEQILNNLIGNVEKYAATGGYLEITHEINSDNTIIQVIDHGPGIPMKEQQNIFEPFYRISSKLSDGVSGTGIGLNIARQLARLHDGDIVLIKTEQGSCFEITLPTSVVGEKV